ncbi:MAG: GreA/GreB family elongation factor, partial [Lentisphaeria bacterium]
EKAMSAAKSGTDKDNPEEVELHTSRSLTELLMRLRQEDRVDAGDEDVRKTVSRLLEDSCDKKNSIDSFVEAVARLYQKTNDTDTAWLADLTKNLAVKTAPWQDKEIMAAVTNRLKAGLAKAWLQASAEALPAARFAELCMQLPLRALAVAEKAAEEAYGEIDTWDKEMRRQIKTNLATADQLVNVWRRDGRNARDLSNAGLILRTIGKPAAGPYIQARKALHKLLMQDEKFQDHMVGDGDEEVAPGFIAAVKHSATLQLGERQSLLVKLVRRYPDLIPYVEERAAGPKKKKVAPVTSESSYQRIQKELQSIIREKIPANSKAIAHARSYGDLRENAEYKAAKEEQAYLSSRRNELEDSLEKVRPVNFREISDPDKVVPGVHVKLQDGSGNSHTYYVLGMWDSDPDRDIISYATPLGKKMLGKKEGDQITNPAGEELQIVKICRLPEKILEWQDSSEA